MYLKPWLGNNERSTPRVCQRALESKPTSATPCGGTSLHSNGSFGSKQRCLIVRLCVGIAILVLQPGSATHPDTPAK